jgi:CRP-like cAMP-binding protein
VWSLFQNMPELSFDVTWLGAREESHVDEGLTSVGRRNALESIAALIILLYKRLDALGMVVNGAMPFPLTQQHIADMLGLSLVHTNKSLAKLRRLGMFSLTDGTLLLSNPKALESMAQFFEEETARRPLI